MCEDFDLCENCAVTNSFQQLHREDHLILKLKFKQRRQLPPGCLLKYKKARDMGEEIDYSSVVSQQSLLSHCRSNRMEGSNKLFLL
ncbi:hypothetical protein EB796_000268 [Bugula neritina]|uniref:ZZ-type domain-containing protein n=1 Tax=Bugula neritina TaxID=10212 RepID=A0A7J7KT85_BUGNE|nr:hypothetical protein EB796_000268 [Bugula neritina]